MKMDKNNKTMLPDTIKFLNKNKFVVNMADLMARKYRIKSSSHR